MYLEGQYLLFGFNSATDEFIENIISDYNTEVYKNLHKEFKSSLSLRKNTEEPFDDSNIYSPANDEWSLFIFENHLHPNSSFHSSDIRRLVIDRIINKINRSADEYNLDYVFVESKGHDNGEELEIITHRNWEPFNLSINKRIKISL